jgi:S-formylglutathione hydrolase FrmB
MVAIVSLVGAACGGAATNGPTSVVTTSASTAATASPLVTRTPTPSSAPTIGLPADDGARIIAVEANPLYGAVASARARDITIDSPAVGRIVKVQVLLPNRYDAKPQAEWPVLYVLPGSSGGHESWTNWSDLDTLVAPTDLLVVIPDAGYDDPGGSSYSDWWNGGTGGPPAWETFHLVELRQLLERNWHAGDRRAIVGVSAGGYGAMEYASRHPGMFLFAGAYSGVFDPVGHVQFANAPNALWGDPVLQADVWKAHDPLLNAAALKGTALYVAYGNGTPGALDNYAISPFDPTGDVEREVATESAAFVARLRALKIPVTVYAYGNGTHNGPYVERDLHRSFPLILKALGLQQ